jgi:pyochelin biosynthetic protein PchC
MSAVRRLTAPRRPRCRLICFPHAGGSASFFHGWRSLVPADVELWAVQYPGRHDRIGDPCLDRMEPMLADVLPGLHEAEQMPAVLIGHSLGAAIAYECARRLPDSARALVVSARGGPGRNREETWADRSDEELLAKLAQLGQISPELMGQPELLELVMPSLRADCRLSETYDPDPEWPIDAPVLACVGHRDPVVTTEDILAWEKSTTGPFTHQVYAGDHFYLREHASALIRAALDTMGTTHLEPHPK